LHLLEGYAYHVILYGKTVLWLAGVGLEAATTCYTDAPAC